MGGSTYLGESKANDPWGQRALGLNSFGQHTACEACPGAAGFLFPQGLCPLEGLVTGLFAYLEIKATLT